MQHNCDDSSLWNGNTVLLVQCAVEADAASSSSLLPLGLPYSLCTPLHSVYSATPNIPVNATPQLMQPLNVEHTMLLNALRAKCMP
jgi:hypothetical protein